MGEFYAFKGAITWTYDSMETESTAAEREHEAYWINKTNPEPIIVPIAHTKPNVIQNRGLPIIEALKTIPETSDGDPDISTRPGFESKF